MRRLAEALLLAVSLLLSGMAVAAPLVPEFFDPDHRRPQPDFGALKEIRFETTDDFPPFHFALADGTLVGFDVDLARAICQDLKIGCVLQAKRFDALIGDLKARRADAAIAAIANNPATRADLSFTAPYYTTPGRFVGRAEAKTGAMTPEGLSKHTVGVVSGTAHEAYLKTFFPEVVRRPYRSEADMRAALRTSEVDLVFTEGIGAAIWLNDPSSAACCAFKGGPYTESRYFGNGVSIAVVNGNDALREVLDFELAKLTAAGVYGDLYLKYFPIGFY